MIASSDTISTHWRLLLLTSSMYEQVAHSLRSAAISVDAAEAHGALCGCICGGGTAIEDWLGALEAETASVAPEARACEELVRLHAATLSDLQGQQMEFAPLLSDDEQSLEVRTAALASWCQGFLYGFGLTVRTDPRQLSAEAREALSDFAELTRATSEEPLSAREERAYSELLEFVRVGTQLLFDELCSSRRPQPPPAGPRY